MYKFFPQGIRWRRCYHAFDETVISAYYLSFHLSTAYLSQPRRNPFFYGNQIKVVRYRLSENYISDSISTALSSPLLSPYTHNCLMWSHTNISKLTLATKLDIYLLSIYHTCGAYPLHLRHELCFTPSWRVISALSLHRDRQQPRISVSVCLEGNPLPIIS